MDLLVKLLKNISKDITKASKKIKKLKERIVEARKAKTSNAGVANKLKQNLDQKVDEVATIARCKLEAASKAVEAKGNEYSAMGRVKVRDAIDMQLKSIKQLNKSQVIADQVTAAQQSGKAEVVVPKNDKPTLMSLQEAEEYSKSLAQKAADKTSKARATLKEGKREQAIGNSIQTVNEGATSIIIHCIGRIKSLSTHRFKF